MSTCYHKTNSDNKEVSRSKTESPLSFFSQLISLSKRAFEYVSFLAIYCVYLYTYRCMLQMGYLCKCFRRVLLFVLNINEVILYIL